MPTPVDSARACVAGDAARALDDAVSVARRRAHAQTTSLHVVSALLSPSFPAPLLRDALARARSAAYSSRLQFKALDLCFGVALDRLPSSHPPPSEPPVSNSLMAAIKRSQANQRRSPDTFHLYSGAGIGATTLAGVKVELQQMVLAILDDPVVSRVFGEAGFRSCDIKLAVLRPPPPILRLPRSARCPPRFLCNFDAPSFPFPLSSPTAVDENCRRIGEIVAKKSARNPILVGVGAEDAAGDFVRAVEQQSAGVVPAELRGVKVVKIEDWNAGEVENMVRGAEAEAETGGVLVSVGDLKGLVESEDTNVMVAELTRVFAAGKGKLWVMGWSVTYEMYMNLLSKYPSLGKDWDLQLLPITSVKNAAGGMSTRPQSLMESFVPFGGFFPLACESKCSPSSPYQSTLRCQLCNEMYEQEVAVTNGCSAPVEDQQQASMPSWLQNSEVDVFNKGLDSAKAKDDKALLNTKVLDLQKKWNDNCQRLHHGFQLLEANNYQLVPHSVGPRYLSNKEGSVALGNQNPGDNQKQSTMENVFPVADGQEVSTACSTVSLPAIAESKTNLSEFQVRLSKSEQLWTEGFRSHPGKPDVATHDDLASPSSVTSVKTDLVLGTPKAPSNEVKHACGTQTGSLPDLSGSSPTKEVDIFGRNIPKALVQSYSSCYSDSLVKGTATGSHHLSLFEKGCQNRSSLSKYSEPRDYKAFLCSLVDKVGRQEEALCAISQAILHCKLAPERFRGAGLKGDIWLSFHGPDKVGKQRVALALSELLFVSRENFIQLDLSLHDGIACSNAICGMPENRNYAMQFRGKTIADQIVAELSKKPCSVILLENVDKADLLVQNSLSQAIRTGKLSDSHGRQISINNAIFITTMKEVHGRTSFSPKKEGVNFLEERVLAAQAWQMKILIEPLSKALSTAPSMKTVGSGEETAGQKATSCAALASKRKLDATVGCRDLHGSLSWLKRANKSSNTFLDLNLPVEEVVGDDAYSSNSNGSHSISDNSDAWLEEFLEFMDERVNFKPFNFDSLADSIRNQITKSFHRTVGSESILEIDIKAMEQILAATWLLEDRKQLQNWIDLVLCRSFTKVRWRSNVLNPAVFRLVACQDVFMQEQAPGILLPSEITLD